MTPPHTCTQDGRFDRVEVALDEIKDAIKQITDLMVSSARVDEQLKVVMARVLDFENRLRTLETTNAIARWIERVILALISGAVVYFISKGG